MLPDSRSRHVQASSGSRLGDGGVALFPIEIDAKDAASLAIRAGLEIVEACRRVGREAGRNDLHVRVGIATSIAVIQGTQTEDWTREPVTGAALAMATRLEAIAAPDTVFVSQETRDLAGRSHAFAFQGTRILKGFAEPEKVWHAIGHKKEVDRFYAFGRLGGPFIGRASELDTIARFLEKRCCGTGEVLLIEGEAGIGKSRLLHEVRRITRTQRSKLVLFQCLPGGSRSTLHPLLHSFPGRMSKGGGHLRLEVSNVAAMFERNGIYDAEVIEIFAYLLGAGKKPRACRTAIPRPSAKRHVTPFQRARVMCEMGRYYLIVEDVHWIDPSSQDLLAEAARYVHQLPALLVVTSRLKFANGLAGRIKPNAHLAAAPGSRRNKTGNKNRWPEHRLAVLPEFLDVTERVSGGVPLFIEEICQWVSESVEADTTKMAGAVSPTHVSAFEGILDARLYRLGSARDVARAGAVAGNRFNLSLLRALLPDFGKKSLIGALDTLCEAGFLTRVRAPGTLPMASATR